MQITDLLLNHRNKVKWNQQIQPYAEVVMGRKAFEPTDEHRAKIASLVSFGIPKESIAEYLGISKDVLYKYFEDEMKTATIKASKQVGDFLFYLASGMAIKDGASYAECSRAAMFWAKTRMGWRETDRLEHTGVDGQPIDMNIKVNFVKT